MPGPVAVKVSSADADVAVQVVAAPGGQRQSGSAGAFSAELPCGNVTVAFTPSVLKEKRIKLQIILM